MIPQKMYLTKKVKRKSPRRILTQRRLLRKGVICLISKTSFRTNSKCYHRIIKLELNIFPFEICLIEKVFQHLRSLLKFLNSPKSNQLLKLLKEIGTFEFYLIKSLYQICPKFERLSTATDGNVR